MIGNNLKKLGFHENEVKVYLALHELGKAKAGAIIENLKIHRNLVYTALESLEAKGVVSKVLRKGVALFEANSPKTIVEMVEEKKSLAEDVAEELAKKQESAPRDIKVFDGIEGIVRSRDRSLDLPAGETLYVLGGSGLSSTPEFERYWDKFHKKRIKNKINHKILFDRTVPAEYVEKRNALPLCQAKYLPMSVDLPAMFDMFGDIFTISIPGESPVAFSLRSKAAAESMKKYFEYLWDQEVSVETGMEALKNAFYPMIDELNSGEEYYVLGASTNTYDSDEGNLKVQTFFNNVHKYRIKKGVVVKMLAYREYVERGKQRFVDCGDPAGKVSFIKPFISTPRVPMQINLYKNKTLIIFYGETPTVLKFERPEMFMSFKAYFESMWEQDTYILRGAKALQEIWFESINAGESRQLGPRGYMFDRFPELTKPVVEKMRKTKNVYWRFICDPTMRGHDILKFSWVKVKYNLAFSKNYNVIWLWGNKVAIVNWAENEPIIFVSENKHLVQSNNDYFDELWNKK